MPITETIRIQLSKQPIQAAVLLLLIVCVGLLVYWPGLSGSFQLDDNANLNSLGQYTYSDIPTRILTSVFSGQAGPAGRPLSLLSFFANDMAWPSDAWAFKYTNVLLHLLNGILIFYLAWRLLPYLSTKLAERKEYHVTAAGLCALVWTLHPLQLSTALYVVQRMTELSATFIILGLISYIHVREQLQNNVRAGYIKLSLSILVFTPLAILSKENGILLILYIIVLEATLFERFPIANKYWKYWKHLFLLLPVILLVAYFSFAWDKIQAGYAMRDFGLWERLLTEARVLFEYVYRILLPKFGGNGLYHDDYIVSRGLLDPPSTVLCVIGVVSFLIAAIKLRKRFPLPAFVILWYFASHALESTFIPLELYFEHRNYLALFGFSLMLSAFLLSGSVKIQRIVQFSSVVLLITLAVFTRIDADVWGKPLLMSTIWHNEHPRSIRASQDAADFALHSGHMQQAQDIIEQALVYHPNDSGLLMQRLMLSCLSGEYREEDFSAYRAKLVNGDFSNAALEVITYMSKQVPYKNCPQFTLQHVIQLTSVIMRNSKFQIPQHLHMFHYYRGHMYIRLHDLNAAMSDLDSARKYKESVIIAIEQVSLLLSAGLYQDAQRYLQIASKADKEAANPLLRNLHRREISLIDEYINKKLAAKADGHELGS